MCPLQGLTVDDVCDDFRLGEIKPRRPALSWFAECADVSLPLTNLSDRAATFRLEAEDRGDLCRFEFHAPGEPAALIKQMDMRLAPGQTAEVAVRIVPRKRQLIGLTRQEHLCTISATMLTHRIARRTVLVRLASAPLIGPVVILLVTLCAFGLLSVGLRQAIEQMAWNPPMARMGVPGGARPEAQPDRPRQLRRSIQGGGINRDLGGPGALTYEEMFREIAEHYQLDWRLLAELAYQESRLNPLAFGGSAEMGLMQIRPSTWLEFAPAAGVTDPYDPYSSALVAAAYLVYLKEYLTTLGYPEDYWMLAAYNWGPDNLHRMLIAGGGWTGVPEKTQRYALRILQAAGGGSLSPAAGESMAANVLVSVRLSQLQVTGLSLD